MLVDPRTGDVVEQDVNLKVYVVTPNEGPDNDCSVTVLSSFSHPDKGPLLRGGSPLKDGSVELRVRKGLCDLSVLSITKSTQAFLGRKNAQFKLLVQESTTNAEPVQAMCESFEVMTDRPDKKPEFPHENQPMTVLEGIGKPTADKLLEFLNSRECQEHLRANLTKGQAYTKFASTHSDPLTVRQFREFMQLISTDHILQQKMKAKQVGFSAKAKEHAERAVADDCGARLWMLTEGGAEPAEGLVFPSLTQTRDEKYLGEPLGVMVRSQKGSDAWEYLPVAELTYEENQVMKEMQRVATLNWWRDVHPGWSCLEVIVGDDDSPETRAPAKLKQVMRFTMQRLTQQTVRVEAAATSSLLGGAARGGAVPTPGGPIPYPIQDMAAMQAQQAVQLQAAQMQQQQQQMAAVQMATAMGPPPMGAGGLSPGPRRGTPEDSLSQFTTRLVDAFVSLYLALEDLTVLDRAVAQAEQMRKQRQQLAAQQRVPLAAAGTASEASAVASNSLSSGMTTHDGRPVVLLQPSGYTTTNSGSASMTYENPGNWEHPGMTHSSSGRLLDTLAGPQGTQRAFKSTTMRTDSMSNPNEQLRGMLQGARAVHAVPLQGQAQLGGTLPWPTHQNGPMVVFAPGPDGQYYEYGAVQQ